MNTWLVLIKEIVYPKISLTSSFCCWTQKMIFWRMLVARQFLDPIHFYSIFFFLQWNQWVPSTVWIPTKYHLLCSTEERNSNRFGTVCGWVNDDRIFLTILLTTSLKLSHVLLFNSFCFVVNSPFWISLWSV